MTNNTAHVTYEVTTNQIASYPPDTLIEYDGDVTAYIQGYVNTIPHSDNFSRLSNYWTAFSSPPGSSARGEVAVSSNQLQLTLNDNSHPLYAGVLTTQPLQVTNGSVVFQFAQPGQAAVSSSGVNLGLGLFSARETNIPNVFPFATFLNPDGIDPASVPNISLLCSSGDLVCTYYSGAGSGTDFSATYDPVNHKYGQISVSVSGGVEYAYFSVSPDGETWTQVCTMNTANRGGGTMDVAWVALYVNSTVNQPSAVSFDLSDYGYSGVTNLPVQAVASASVTILDSSGNFVASTGSGLPEKITAIVNAGDSKGYIKQNLIGAIRVAANDPSVEIVFHP